MLIYLPDEVARGVLNWLLDTWGDRRPVERMIFRPLVHALEEEQSRRCVDRIAARVEARHP